MQFKLVTTTTPAVDPRLQWLFFSDQTKSFIVGDEKRAYAQSVSGSATLGPLPGTPADTGAVATHPCNLPIPRGLYDEFAGVSWHGFKFMEYTAYDHAIDGKGYPVGDLLRTLVFGPDYGHYVVHPHGKTILGLRSGSIEMLRFDGDAFTSIDRTKTRGKAALAFAAHPEEALIAYGDNYGTFHSQRFDAAGFGKAGKIVAKDRKASRLEFVDAGRTLVIGGMGYLETYAYDGKKFTPAHHIETSVRDFLWLNEGELVLVNGGTNGITAFAYNSNGFSKLASVRSEGPVNQIAVSTCGGYVAVSEQERPILAVYELSRE
jgi:hypothetical protein